jgi:hypothetical protein
MKAKKLPSRQLLMDIAGRVRLEAYRARLGLYQKKLEPARGVSRVRLGSYLEKILKLHRDKIIKFHHTIVICLYAHMRICRYRCMRIAA